MSSVLLRMFQKTRKTTQAEDRQRTSLEEKETYWLRRAVSPLHQNGGGQLAGVDFCACSSS
eukprot:377284-Pelagomonas_calceolata.AAC.1